MAFKSIFKLLKKSRTTLKFVFSARKHPVLLNQKQIRLMAKEEAELFSLWKASNWTQCLRGAASDDALEECRLNGREILWKKSLSLSFACLLHPFLSPSLALAAPRGVQDLVPWPERGCVPPAVGVQSLNHWTAWEAPPSRSLRASLQGSPVWIHRAF